MSRGELRFEAEPMNTGERIALVRIEPGRLFSKGGRTAIPVEDWVLSALPASRPAVAKILQAIGDGARALDGEPLVASDAEAVVLHPALVAQLTESEALALGLPPVARLSLNLQSIGVAHQNDFRVEARWSRPNGLPAPVKLMGARLSFEGKTWRVANGQRSVPMCDRKIPPHHV